MAGLSIGSGTGAGSYERSKQFSTRTLTVAGIAVIVGVVLALSTAGLGYSAWPDGLRWSSYMVASLIVASLIGLIFGIPKARASVVADSKERYEANSNLERISDWLTTLLVGATLVQLKDFPQFAVVAGDYLGAGMKIPNAGAFSVVAVVYGMGVGFVSGYLLTRVRLRPVFESSDLESREISTEQALQGEVNIANVVNPAGKPESARRVQRAVDAAITASAGRRGTARVLWVDDHPSNYGPHLKLFAQLDIAVEFAESTAQAEARLSNAVFDVIISDLGRIEGGTHHPMAGRELILAIRAKSTTPPIVIYGSKRAVNYFTKLGLKRVGAAEVTNRASDLLKYVAQLVTTNVP